jgi:hypothetical protein
MAEDKNTVSNRHEPIMKLLLPNDSKDGVLGDARPFVYRAINLPNSSRNRYHYRGNAEGSTLRLTLGCLLSSSLGLRLRRVGSGKRLTFADGEARLSESMSAVPKRELSS